VHSSSCGALLRLWEAICDYADCLCELTPAWPSRALSQEDIKLWVVTFRLGRHAHVAGRLDNDLVIELHQMVLLQTLSRGRGSAKIGSVERGRYDE